MLDTLDRPRTLKETALQKLREAITLGVLAPGQRLVERVLCEQLGVSRTVVRECIRHLESERLVTSVPNTGPSVTVLGAGEVREIYAIRVLLETDAVRSCAQRATDAIVTRLKQYCAAIEQALQREDILAALSFTTQFYECIFAQGDKTVSWDLVERMNGRISRLRALTLASDGRITAGPDHLRRIIEAIEMRDAGAAAQACENHIAQASRIALRELGNESA